MPESNTGAADSVWVAVPAYNNRETVKAVASHCRRLMPHVVVVDDGSTDCDLASFLSGLDITILRHRLNLGKGQAILTASRYVEEQGGAYLITIDADGQHDPEDILRFLPCLEGSSSSLVVGCRNFNTANVPASSRFGRKFANFWLKVETGLTVDDCQSGFRAYPVGYLNRLSFK
jgi:glycosyltransferase involved in cell wall biosynthesis